MRVKYLPKKLGVFQDLSRFPNFHKTGSAAGMKRHFYGPHALLVRCGSHIYNVSSDPSIYYKLAH